MISVTHILKIINDPSLQEFKESVGIGRFESIMNRAAIFGTSNHKIFENYILRREISKFDDAIEDQRLKHEIFIRYKEWYDRNVSEDIYVEHEFKNEALGYIGHPDHIIRNVKGKVVLIDWKFVAELQRQHYYQVAAYEHFFPKGYVDEVVLILEYG